MWCHIRGKIGTTDGVSVFWIFQLSFSLRLLLHAPTFVANPCPRKETLWEAERIKVGVLDIFHTCSFNLALRRTLSVSWEWPSLHSPFRWGGCAGRGGGVKMLLLTSSDSLEDVFGSDPAPSPAPVASWNRLTFNLPRPIKPRSAFK